MENNFFRRIPTDLDLNGPVLEYTTQPSDASGDKDASVTFTVAAQALFPGDSGAEDGGTITYQWFEVGVGALSNGGQFSGVTTVTLTVSDLRTPQDQGRKFYCEVSYSPNNEYGTTGSGTGTAVNQPLKSNEATISVNPELEIIAQPTDRTVGKNATATFSINAGLTDETYLSDGAVIYQWYVGIGNATPILVSDGTVQTTNITSEVVTVEEEGIAYDTETFTESQSFGNDGSVSIPPTGYDISFTVAAGGGGNGGSDSGALQDQLVREELVLSQCQTLKQEETLSTLELVSKVVVVEMETYLHMVDLVEAILHLEAVVVVLDLVDGLVAAEEVVVPLVFFVMVVFFLP